VQDIVQAPLLDAKMGLFDRASPAVQKCFVGLLIACMMGLFVAM
jgi:hypothetical protein